MGWEWLNQNAWVGSALLVIAFLGGALTMAWHIMETRSRRASYLVVAALLLLALSFVGVGVSVGDRPILTSRVLIPYIRILWFVAAVLLNAFIVVFWAARVRWSVEKEREWHELSNTR